MVGPTIVNEGKEGTTDFAARLRAAQEKAWWKDMTGLVSSTDRQLVVISPRSDATADDLRGLGQALALWRAARISRRPREISTNDWAACAASWLGSDSPTRTATSRGEFGHTH